MAKKKKAKGKAGTDEYGRRVLTPEHQARRSTVGPVKTVEPAPETEQPAPEAEE